MKQFLLATLLNITLCLQVYSQTFTNTTGGPIPDNKTETCFPITVSGIGSLSTSLGVTGMCMNINHTYDADLDIFLVAPDGTRIEIVSDKGSINDNFTNTCFSSTSTNNINATGNSAPFTGTYGPAGLFGTFNNGLNADGVWTLCITDDRTNDAGTLLNWSLTFGGSAQSPPPSCAVATPAADDCSNSPSICDLNGYCGNTSSAYNPDTLWNELDAAFCGNMDNGSFITFVAGATSASLNIWVGNCNYGGGIQTMIFSAGGCSGPVTSKVCNNQIKPGGPVTVTATGLTPGNTYYLYVDGYAGNVCNYYVSVPANGGVLLPVTASSDQTICSGQSKSITASGGNGSYTWTGGTLGTQIGSSVNISPSVTTTYTVTSTFNNPLCPLSNTDYVTITVNNSPVVTAKDTSICSGNSINLGAVVSPAGGTYSWNTGSASSTITVNPLTTTNYTLTYTQNGCSTSDIATVTIGSAGTLTTSFTQAGCSLSNGTATASLTGGTAPFTYTWSNGATTATAGSLASGTYTVTITDARNCVSNGTVTITNPSSPTLSATAQNNTCSGGTNGSIDVTVAGGTAPYTYSWTNGSINQDLTNLAQGTYQLTVTDANNCKANYSTSLTDPAPINSSASTTNNNCFGSTNGSATISASGGTGPYTYTWLPNVSATNSANSLSAGNYTVQVKDNNNCISTVNFSITEPNDLSIAFTSTSPTCSASNGAISTNISGGTSGYTYTWSNGSNSANLTGISSGNYTLTVNDSKNCSKTSSITLNPLSGGTINTIKVNHPSCAGGNNGSIQVSVSGGTGPFTYTWNTTPVQYNATATGLSAGSYTVQAKDINGCISTQTYVLTDNTAITATASVTNETCFGNCNGTASLVISGGVSPYSVSWNTFPIQNTISANGLCAGNYTATITDSVGCNLTQNITIAPGDSISVTANVSATQCTSPTGTIALALSGGTIPYTVNWSNGASGTNIGGLSTGLYTATINDAKGCIKTHTINVSSLNAPTISVTSISNNICFGQSIGSINTSVSGGTAPYTYSWNNGQITPGLTGLPEGVYNLIVSDASGCSASISQTITSPDSLYAISSLSHLTCSGSCTGAISLAVSGGVSPYTLNWSDPDHQTGLIADSLCAGSIGVIITDANNCQKSYTYLLNQPAAINVALTGVTPTCAGSCDGNANVTVAGGSGSYQIQWNDLNAQTGNTALLLCAGTYVATVTDNSGCKASGQITLNDPLPISLAINGNDTTTCFGICDGSILASATGGSGLTIYSWNNGATTPVMNNLCPGTYLLTVTDSKGCTKDTAVTIYQPDSITISAIVIPPTCSNSCNGSITPIVSGGTGSYTYLYTPSLITNTNAIGLCGSTETLVVTDGNNCTASHSYTINAPAAITATDILNTPSHCNLQDGQACISASGGSGPLSYSWTNTSNTTNCESSLAGGAYPIIISDTAGCNIQHTVIISDISGPAVSINPVTNVICSGENSGNATAVISGGTTPYTLLWNNGSANASINNLNAGIYIATVTDSAGCVSADTVTISEPTAIAIAATSLLVPSCSNTQDGSITVAANGSNGGFTYNWINPSVNGNTLTNISGGSYSVIATDINGCKDTLTINLTSPNALTLNYTAIEPSCYGYTNGSIVCSPAGGNNPYSFNWLGQSNTTNFINNIGTGTYQVVVTDNGNCRDTTTIILNQPNDINLTVSTQSVTCGQINGQAIANVTGGTTPYQYFWSPTGETGNSSNSLWVGSNTVTVTDSNGCIKSVSFLMDSVPAPLIQVTGVNPSCYSSADGAASAQLIPGFGTAPFNYNWQPAGQTTNIIQNLIAGTYTVTVTDANNCQVGGVVILTEPNEIIVSAMSDTLVCQGSNVLVYANASGGTGNLVYNWTPSVITGNSGIQLVNSNSNFQVNVTDQNNCVSVTKNISVSVITPLSVQIQSPAVICNGDNVTLQALSSGGIAPISYTWLPVSGNTDSIQISSITNGSGPFYLYASDGCGTFTGDTITPVINALPIPGMIINTTGNYCSPLIVNFSAQGAQPGETYLWNFGDGTTGSGSNITHTYTEADTFIVNLTSITAAGCSATTTLATSGQVVVFPTPSVAFTMDPPNSNPTITEAAYDFQIKNTSNAASYVWNFGTGIVTELNPHYEYSDTGKYCIVLKGTSLEGCVDSSIQCIKVESDYQFYVPNTFTPNKDGLNDLFMIKGYGIASNNFKLRIFDRWGNLIFETDKISNGWNGQRNGVDCLIDVYSYQIDAITYNNKTLLYTGTFNLIR